MRTRKRKKVPGSGVNFVITLFTVSIIFVLIGFLMGEYAVQMLQKEHRASMELQRAQERLAQPVFTPSPTVPEGLDNQRPSGSTPGPSIESGHRAEPTPATPQSASALYRVQVGAFTERANADRLVASLKEAGYEGLVTQGPPYRVQTGAFSSQENAEKLMNELKAKGFEAIIVR